MGSSNFQVTVSSSRVSPGFPSIKVWHPEFLFRGNSVDPTAPVPVAAAQQRAWAYRVQPQVKASILTSGEHLPHLLLTTTLALAPTSSSTLVAFSLY